MNRFVPSRVDPEGHAAFVAALAEAATAGTPAYTYSLEVITARWRILRTALGTPLTLELAACPLQEMFSRLPGPVRASAAVASRAELALIMGWQSDKAYLRAPYLPTQTVRAFLGSGARLVAESLTQVEALIALRGRRQVHPVGLALAPSALGPAATGLGAGPAERNMGERGMGEGDLRRALALLGEAGIAVDGLAVPFRARFEPGMARAVLEAIRQKAHALAEQAGGEFARLHLGEWLGPRISEADCRDYRALIEEIATRTEVFHAAGQSLFEPAGILVTRVVDRIGGGPIARVICDASIANALPATEAGGTWRDRSGLRRLVAADTAGAETDPRATGETLVMGASGLPGDVLGVVPGTLLPGDLLYLENMGAYARTASPHALCGLGPARAVLVTG